MKRFLSIILTVIMIATSVMCASVFAADEIKVTINGKEKAFDVTPVIINDRTLVPMRGIFEELGAIVTWDGVTQSVTANVANGTIVLQVGKIVALVNGQYVSLDAPARLIEGRTMVPVRFIAETLGCEVNWEDSSRTVVIKGEVKKVESTPSGGDTPSKPADSAPDSTFTPVDDGWDDMVVIGFENSSVAPSSGLNFWGTKPEGGNANYKYAYTTYSEISSGGISKPSTTENFGSGLLKLDVAAGSDGPTTDGIAVGRINDIPATDVPYAAGGKYKMSVWLYLAETVGGGSSSEIRMSGYSGKNAEGFARGDSVTLNKGQWVRYELEFEASADNVGETTGARFYFAKGRSGDYPKVIYIDNLSFEKQSGSK